MYYGDFSFFPIYESLWHRHLSLALDLSNTHFYDGADFICKSVGFTKYVITLFQSILNLSSSTFNSLLLFLQNRKNKTSECHVGKTLYSFVSLALLTCLNAPHTRHLVLAPSLDKNVINYAASPPRVLFWAHTQVISPSHLSKSSKWKKVMWE